MQHRFTRTNASIKIHLGERLLQREQVKSSGLSIMGILPKPESRKNLAASNGMRDETHIPSTRTPGEKILSTATESTPVKIDNLKVIDRSGGNMLTSIQEHLYSRIPVLSETLPL